MGIPIILKQDVQQNLFRCGIGDVGDLVEAFGVRLWNVGAGDPVGGFDFSETVFFSIRALPPLNRKGQLDLARASSREKALMVFSISVGSLTLLILQDSRIHSRVLLLGSIIAWSILSVSLSPLSCLGGRHSGAWFFCRCGTFGRHSHR